MVGGSADEPQASRLARRAHHATRAATRSTIDAAQAVGVARAAAQAMVRGYAYEQAADLLATASRIHADARLYGGAALHVEEAQAVLQAGRLAEARSLFDRAAAGAEDEGEPILLAEAALGLGGVWVNEHRTPVEWRRVRALQKRALAGLPAGEDALASRLRTRLAAEAVYVGESPQHVLDCLADARRLGDPLALAEALSLTHHVLLTPEHTRDRLALADELVAVASSAGLGVLALDGSVLADRRPVPAGRSRPPSGRWPSCGSARTPWAAGASATSSRCSTSCSPSGTGGSARRSRRPPRRSPSAPRWATPTPSPTSGPTSSRCAGCRAETPRPSSSSPR